MTRDRDRSPVIPMNGCRNQHGVAFRRRRIPGKGGMEVRNWGSKHINYRSNVDGCEEEAGHERTRRTQKPAETFRASLQTIVKYTNAVVRRLRDDQDADDPKGAREGSCVLARTITINTSSRHLHHLRELHLDSRHSSWHA